MSRKNSYPSRHSTGNAHEVSGLTRRKLLVRAGLGVLGLTGATAIARGLEWLGEQGGNNSPANDPNKLSNDLRKDLANKAKAMDQQITAVISNTDGVKGERFPVVLRLSPALVIAGEAIEIPAPSTDPKEPKGAYRLETYYHDAEGGQVGDRVSVDESVSTDGKEFFKVRQTVITREPNKSVSLVIEERDSLVNPTIDYTMTLNTSDPTRLHISKNPYNAAGETTNWSIPVPPNFADTAYRQAMHTISLSSQPLPAAAGSDFVPYIPPETV
jgi:hypothetical protein